MGVLEREIRANEIIEAAEKVFFSKGFEHSKMEDVAKEAGLSKGLLYFYFNGKEELHLAITYKAFEIVLKLHQSSINHSNSKRGLEVVLKIVSDYMDFCKEHSQYQELILNHITLLRTMSRKALPKDAANRIKTSSYFLKIESISRNPADLVVQQIQKGQKDGSILIKEKAELIYLTLWAWVIGYTKLNVAHEKGMTAILYDVQQEDWKNYILKLIEEMLKKSEL